MKLNEISDRANSMRGRSRVGRGIGSGKGKRSGHGDKGQKSRSGVALKGFEGGQMPIHRRLPKRGFNNIFRKRFAVVNVGRLQVAFDAGKRDPSRPITGATLVDAGVINQLRDGVRLLGKGDLSAKVSIEVEWASAAAMAAVEKAGGEVSVLRKPKTDSSAKKGRQSKKAKSSEVKDQAEEVAASNAVQKNDGASDSDSNPE